MIISFFRLIIFLLSVYGYMAFSKEKLEVENECLPIVVFSGIGSIVFISGILNTMYVTFLSLLGVGIILTIYYVVKKRNYLPVSPGLCFGALFLIFLFVCLMDEKYYDYDNFTHWGLVVKNIYAGSAFPNFQDSIIAFQSYPLGSAGFIWYVCRCIGYSEGLTMFAQNALILSCALPFFMLPRQIKYGKGIAYIIAGLICVIDVCGGSNMANGPFNLLVDKLLACIAIAAFVIVYQYRKQLKKAMACVLPLLTLVIVVKNSGIMWVAAIFFETIYFWRKYSNHDRKQIRQMSLLIVIPALFRFLWDKHVDLVFASGEFSYHAMSAENYSVTLRNKSAEDIKMIASMFAGRVFTWKNHMVMYVVVFILLFGVCYLLDKKILKKTDGLFLILYAVIIYSIYQVGNFVMYLVSMPLSEAQELAGYERYVATVEWFVWGIVVMTLLVIMTNIDCTTNAGIYVAALCGFGAILLWPKMNDIVPVYRHDVPVSGRETARIHMDEIVSKYQLESGKKSLVYIGDPQDRDVGYRGWMSKYVLYSNDVTMINQQNIDTMKNFRDYDYLIILERDDLINTFLTDLGLTTEEDCIKVSDYLIETP